MSDPARPVFDLEDFLPYLLSQAAEATSRRFAARYRAPHGLGRTEWRVMAHLGRFGAMTAREIGQRSQIEKSAISRAVAALEGAGRLTRRRDPADRRSEILALTAAGQALFHELGAMALAYEAELRAELGPESAEMAALMLRQLIRLAPSAGDEG